MTEIVKQNITGIQWIASESWITAPRPSTPEIYQAFGGTLGFVVQKMAMPNLKPFLTSICPYKDPSAAFVSDFWEIVVGCRPVLPGEDTGTTATNKTCTGNETLSNSQDMFFNVTELRDIYNVYKAVYAIAHALHQLVFCQPAGNKTLRPCLNISEIQPKQNRVCGCELFGRFNMPSLFKQGDIMIGGIFPVFIKEIISTSVFKREPPEMKCEGIIPYKDPSAAFVRDFWEIVVGCRPVFPGEDTGNETTHKICTGNETFSNSQHTFFNVTELRDPYNVYKAVYAIAHALHQLVFCQPAGNKTLRPCLNISEIQPKQNQMKEIQEKVLGQAEIVKQNITGIQWIASEALITAPRPYSPEIYQAFDGTIGIVVKKMVMPSLNPFLMSISPYKDPSAAFVRDYWEIVVGCRPVFPGEDTGTEATQKICTGNETINSQHMFFEVNELRVVYNVYNAVYAISHALHQLVFCQPAGEKIVGPCLNISEIQPKQTMQSKCSESSILLLSLSVLYLNTVCGCEVFHRFKMPSLFQQGDIMIEIVKQNITGIQWIASEAWITTPRLSSPEIYKAFSGTIGIVVKKMVMPSLKPFLMSISPYKDPSAAFVRDYWEIVVGCRPVFPGEDTGTEVTHKICTGNERINSQHVFFGVNELRVVYNVYNAVYAIAHALHQLVFCQPVGEQTVRPCLNISEIQPKKVDSGSGLEGPTQVDASSVPVPGLAKPPEGFCFQLLAPQVNGRVNDFSISITSPASSSPKECTLQNGFQPGFVAQGDYVIGGIFPLHYNQEMPDLNSTYKPPAVKCNGDASPLLAVIGESGSAQSIVVSRILQPFRIPMVKAIAQLLVYFNWTWVGLVRGDHEYGRFAVQGLLRELQSTKVCVAYQVMIPLLYNRHKALEIMQLQYYIQDVIFNIDGEEVNFDLKGDSVPYYDIINWQRGTAGNIELVNVGLFDGTKPAREELVIQEDKIMWAGHQNSVDCTFCPDNFWSNKDRTACSPKEVEFLAYDSLGIALTVISVVGACLTIAVLGVFFYNKNTAIVRVNNSELSFFILFALILCFLCSLVFIGEPTSWSCMLRHTAFSITFSLCISCILGKTLVVLAAFTATRPGDNIMKWLGPKQQRTIIFSGTIIQKNIEKQAPAQRPENNYGIEIQDFFILNEQVKLR
ncbi:Extracellular calcium-sensing receptor [Channa argus]|uniref:Extracellular calcium-sensing receptor n=1 Tax=Channa argus TaxID=215402 RepID=A0A6G1PRQ1_CHAAH|nr:Extracellular calcium-sensing receptor [Channa argus]